MSYELRMTAEIAEWLGDLRESDSVTAAEVAAALVALMQATDAESSWFVTRTGDPVPGDPRERLDDSYQRLLDLLQQLRRQGADPNEIQRLRADVDAFRTSKETAKAMATAADARRRVADAFRAAGIEEDDAETEADLREMTARTDAALAQADQLLSRAMAAAGLCQPASSQAGTDPGDRAVLELHAGLIGAEIRILFGVEPAGTLTLLSVLEGADAISEHGDEAAGLAAALLAEIRHGGWSSDLSDGAGTGSQFADPGTFLEKCFPDSAGVITDRAGQFARVASLRSPRGGRDQAR